MCLCFYNVLLHILPLFEEIYYEQRGRDGGRDIERKGKRKTFNFSQESKIIQAQKSQNFDRKNIPPSAIALENAFSVWCLIPWHLSGTLKLVKCIWQFALDSLWTIFSCIWIWKNEKKGKRLAGKRVGGKVETNTNKAKNFLRGTLVWLQPLVYILSPSHMSPSHRLILVGSCLHCWRVHLWFPLNSTSNEASMWPWMTEIRQ